MKSLTIAISLRAITLVILCLYMFGFYNMNTPYHDFLLGINPYLLTILMGSILLMSRQQHTYKESRKGEPITIREKILPEFNIHDEREAEITGSAAKSAFSLVLIYTPFAIAVVAYLLYYGNFYSTLFIFLTMASIPIAGLIAYYFVYRHHYYK